jgi:dethiobiotin synthetase/adenosylmethionine--8-amino-7-oxononanoate aminotransferase
VFTGLFRLGRFSSSSFLQINPDISVHAKLLTGGLVPLCTTLASESIYNAFLGSEKRDALLHGHSYTAHPVGCHVANTSLKALMELDTGGAWDEYKTDWRGKVAAVEEVIETETDKEEKVSWEKQQVWSVWSKDFVDRISFSNEVESLIALGSVLAIKLQDENAGTSSIPNIRS